MYDEHRVSRCRECFTKRTEDRDSLCVVVCRCVLLYAAVNTSFLNGAIQAMLLQLLLLLLLLLLLELAVQAEMQLKYGR